MKKLIILAIILSACSSKESDISRAKKMHERVIAKYPCCSPNQKEVPCMWTELFEEGVWANIRAYDNGTMYSEGFWDGGRKRFLDNMSRMEKEIEENCSGGGGKIVFEVRDGKVVWGKK